MKLSKTSWLILTIGIFIIAFASVGAARSQKTHEQNQLQEELSLAELRLSKLQLEELSSRQEELEKQLSQTISQFEADKAILSQPIGGITASDTLLSIAETCDVEITEIGSPGLASGDLEGITCSVLPLTVTVKGDTYNIINFIVKLNGNFTSGAVKSVEISTPKTSSEEEQEKASANIRLVIYTYQGD